MDGDLLGTPAQVVVLLGRMHVLLGRTHILLGSRAGWWPGGARGISEPCFVMGWGLWAWVCAEGAACTGRGMRKVTESLRSGLLRLHVLLCTPAARQPPHTECLLNPNSRSLTGRKHSPGIFPLSSFPTQGLWEWGLHKQSPAPQGGHRAEGMV